MATTSRGCRLAIQNGPSFHNPPMALRMTKKLLKEGEHSSLDSLLELSASLQAIAHQTKDHAEAVDAIIEKRTPNFTGD